MIRKLFFLVIICFSLQGLAQTEGTEVTVIVQNVPGNEGKVVISLFNEETFMKAPPLQTEAVAIEDGKATVTFKNVVAGEYGIISFHDKNDNGKIDMQANGMPTEAYGVSNNPMSFGPPQWSDARFEVADQPVIMELRF